MQLVPLLCVLIISTRNIFGSILRPFYLLSISLPNLTEESSSLSTEMNITNIIEKLGVGTGTDSEDEIITAEMKQLSKEIIDEVPKIETALKNFMSILLAQSATGNTQAHRDQEDNFVPLTSDSVLRSVRLIIKKINSWMLPDIVQWGFSNPQSEAEAALKRLDTLTRYKVLSSLHGLAIQKGAKPAKLFGLKYFLWSHVWPSLRDSILSDYSSASSPEVLPDEQCLRYILDKFEQSLSSDALDADSELKLVWTANFAEELRSRKQRRQQEAARRQEELQEQQADLRASLLARLEAVDEAPSEPDISSGASDVKETDT